MFRQQKTVVLGLLVFIVAVCAAAVTPPFRAERNLKVLPKDISDQQLDSIMKSYNIALGVQCNFCHVPVSGFKDSLDYASDADPMKEEARRMMRLTISINKDHFYYDRTVRPEYLNVVSCKTCHRGEPFPPED